MSEPKAKTLQERFGFADPDLKTPKHDAIMMWLDGEMEKILAERFSVRKWEFDAIVAGDWRGRSEHEVFSEAESLMKQLGPQAMTDLGISSLPRLTITKRWECPVLNKNYTIGFADMRVCWSTQAVYFEFAYGSPLHYLGSRKGQKDGGPIYFEVKPSIPSAGELIRQLRMYQTYTGSDKWFVVSPDNRFRSIIENQGFGFVQVPPEV